MEYISLKHFPLLKPPLSPSLDIYTEVALFLTPTGIFFCLFVENRTKVLRFEPFCTKRQGWKDDVLQGEIQGVAERFQRVANATSARCIFLHEEAEQEVAQRIAPQGQWQEAFPAKFPGTPPHFADAVSQGPSFLQIVHSKLSDTPLKQWIIQGAQFVEYKMNIVKTFLHFFRRFGVRDSAFVLTIEIGLNIQLDQRICSEEKLWREELVLMQNSREEAQLSEDVPSEGISTCGSTEIAVLEERPSPALP